MTSITCCVLNLVMISALLVEFVFCGTTTPTPVRGPVEFIIYPEYTGNVAVYVKISNQCMTSFLVHVQRSYLALCSSVLLAG